MDSLKVFAEERLSRRLDISPAALYERQRQLVRLRLIREPAKTGPGAGVRASPANVAMLLLSTMASDSLSETATHIVTASRLRSTEGQCPLTREPSFGGALKTILSEPTLAARVVQVVLQRSFAAEIMFIEHHEVRRSQFGAPKDFAGKVRIVSATVTGVFISDIANDLKQEEE